MPKQLKKIAYSIVNIIFEIVTKQMTKTTEICKKLKVQIKLNN